VPFLHPILFWLGLGGVAVPVAVHILNRRRFRVVEWAAMRFLLEALRKNRRRLLLEELLLLLLRCLIVLLAGLALARFVGCGALERLGVDGQGRDIVFVLDDSYSMGQARGEESLFRRATDDLVERIEATTPRDRVAILRTSTPQADRALLAMGQITDRESLTARLGALEPSDLRTALGPALDEARKLFPDGDRPRRLYLLSDFRKVDLAEDRATNRLMKTFSALRGAGVDVVAMDYGRSAGRNLTLQSIELADPFALAGRRLGVKLAIRNNGTQPVRDVPVTLTARFHDGRAFQDVALPEVLLDSVAPGQVWRKELDFTPDLVGSTVLTAELPADELPGDNVASLSLRVRRGVRVLIVDGRPNPGDPTQAGAFFLKTALDPTGKGDHGFVVDVVPQQGLSRTAFTDYDVVFLVSVASFPLRPAVEEGVEDPEQYADVARLEEYVRDGGGLAIFTGPTVDVGFYNRRLYDGGMGLSPLPIRPVSGDAKRRDEFVRLDAGSIRSTGPMAFFSGSLAPAARLIRFFAITPAEDAERQAGPKASLPEVEARFDDRRPGSPAAVSRSFGKGRVVMIYSTASMAWNDWAMDAVGEVQGLYVLFMADLAERLARRQPGRYTALAGEAIDYPVPAAWRDASVTLRPAGKGVEPIPLTLARESDSRPAARYPRPDRAGLWRLTLEAPGGESREVLFARNPDPTEGRLEPGSREHLSAAVGGEDFLYISRSGRLDAAGEGGRSNPYWAYLLAALLGLLMLETMLARKFGHWN
jgi:hypothetical protein